MATRLLTLFCVATWLLPAALAAQPYPAISPIPKTINWSSKPNIDAGKTPPRIAIIIDDLGYQWPNAKALINLDAPLTLAIIPFTPYGKKIAEHAQQHQKEVMVHIPMAPINHRELGSNWEHSLNNDMDQQAFDETLKDMLDDIPHSQGVNNHGGSALTQNEEAMSWLMNKLEERALYFVDSRTTANSVAYAAAKRINIPVAARDVFLDNERDPQSIVRQLQKLSRIALQHGRAIGIGHPYDETLAALANHLDDYKAMGIEVVVASELTNRYSPTLAQSQTTAP